jgi:hypothetical protein
MSQKADIIVALAIFQSRSQFEQESAVSLECYNIVEVR